PLSCEMAGAASCLPGSRLALIAARSSLLDRHRRGLVRSQAGAVGNRLVDGIGATLEVNVTRLGDLGCAAVAEGPRVRGDRVTAIGGGVGEFGDQPTAGVAEVGDQGRRWRWRANN